ncbi:hypothetical protein EGW08_003352 [Elysia chlorotica]|uniref:Uncharacterized protein n=1 Tax=Elysia chlorotica TaxID=188477 RepID=A0A3S0ZY51_ELYCH|nr:hypothetical protein EGW08_003352 [Elysia chlorotica]
MCVPVRPTGRSTLWMSRLRQLVVMVYILTTTHGVWAQGQSPTIVATATAALPSVPSPTLAAAAAATTTAATGQQSQLGADYDYVESVPGVPDVPPQTGQQPKAPAAATSAPPDYGGLFYPLYGEPSPKDVQAPARSAGVKVPNQPGTGVLAPPQANLMIGQQQWGGRGEQAEWLRERLRKIYKFRGNNPMPLAELQVLQQQFPGVNVTQLYNSYGMFGEDGYRGYNNYGVYGEDGYRGYNSYGMFGEDGYRGYNNYGVYGEDGYRGYNNYGMFGEGGYRGGFGGRYGGGYGEGYGEDSFYYNGTWYPSYELDDWYYHNGTWHPSMGDWEDGYFHNGTWYPGLGEMDEWYYHNGTWYPSMGDWEDGYFHNGTWYPGLEGMEDGYYYNGTWYPGWGDAEDGYFYNGTWYPGYEAEDAYEREGPEQEDLMWWQLHHPRWSGQGGGPVLNRPPYAQVPPLSMPGADPSAARLQLLQRLRPGPNMDNYASQFQRQSGPGAFSFLSNYQKTNGLQPRPVDSGSKPPAPPTPAQRNVPGRPVALPVVNPDSARGRQQLQPRPPPPGYVPRASRGSTTGPRSERLMGGSGGRPPPPLPPFGRRYPGEAPPQWNQPNGPPRPGVPGGPPQPGPMPQAAPAGGGSPSVQSRPASPLDPYRNSATVTLGIVLACLVGLALVVLPLLCLLHKYRHEKRVKKRTFLRRAEHGSIDEGIMDAMVMSELGERRGSRVAKLGGPGGRSVWKGGRKAGGRDRGGAIPELQPLDTMASRPDRDLAGLYSYIP